MGRTDNFSIRFDEDKLAFFKERNPTLEKPQQIIDFFLDEFWWKHNGKWDKVVDILEVPTTGRYIAPHVIPEVPKVDQYAAYQNEISEAKSVSEVEAIVRELKKDNIPDWQKRNLEKIGIEKSKTFDF